MNKSCSLLKLRTNVNSLYMWEIYFYLYNDARISKCLSRFFGHVTQRGHPSHVVAPNFCSCDARLKDGRVYAAERPARFFARFVYPNWQSFGVFANGNWETKQWKFNSASLFVKNTIKKTNKIYLHIIHLLSFLSVNRATFYYYNYLFISIEYNSTFNPRKINHKTKVYVKFILNNKKKYFTLLKYKTYYSNNI